MLLALLVGWAAVAAQPAWPSSVTAALAPGERLSVSLTVTGSGCVDVRPAGQPTEPLPNGWTVCGEPGEVLHKQRNFTIEDFATPQGNKHWALGTPYLISFGDEYEMNFVKPLFFGIDFLSQFVGLAVGPNPHTLWWLDKVSCYDFGCEGDVRATLVEADTSGTVTGRRIALPVLPGAQYFEYNENQGLDYHAGTATFYYHDPVNETIMAVDTLGQLRPGFPVPRLGAVPEDRYGGGHIAVSGDYLEMAVLRPTQLDAFRVVVTDLQGRATGQELRMPFGYDALGYCIIVNAWQRDPRFPNEVAYVSTAGWITAYPYTADWLNVVRPLRLSPPWLGVSSWSGPSSSSWETMLTVEAPLADTVLTADVVLLDAHGGEVGRVPVRVTVGAGVSAEPPVPAPLVAGVTIVPNPVRMSGEVSVDVPSPGWVRVSVVDVLGREVSVLSEGDRTAGTHRLPFGTAGLPSGVYVVRVATAGGVATRAVTVVR